MKYINKYLNNWKDKYINNLIHKWFINELNMNENKSLDQLITKYINNNKKIL